MNGWLRWVIGFLATLVLAGWGYTYTATTRLEDTLTARLTRIEEKLDWLHERWRGGR